MKKINLIVFKDNKTKEIMRGMAFMHCPFCKKEILLDVDKVSFCEWQCRNKVSFCEWQCRKENKFAYKLNRYSECKEGFDKVLYAKVDNFNKKTLMEEFENGKSILL